MANKSPTNTPTQSDLKTKLPPGPNMVDSASPNSGSSLRAASAPWPRRRRKSDRRWGGLKRVRSYKKNRKVKLFEIFLRGTSRYFKVLQMKNKLVLVWNHPFWVLNPPFFLGVWEWFFTKKLGDFPAVVPSRWGVVKHWELQPATRAMVHRRPRLGPLVGSQWHCVGWEQWMVRGRVYRAPWCETGGLRFGLILTWCTTLGLFEEVTSKEISPRYKVGYYPPIGRYFHFSKIFKGL